MAVSNNDTSKGYKPINLATDTVSTETILCEQIPLTGTLISASAYGSAFPSQSNIKFFTSGYNIECYDYPYASSSATDLFTITAGHASGSDITASAMVTEKHNIYRLFAQQYMGYDINQDVVPFNVTGVLNPSDNWDPVKISNILFIDFSRVLVKDEIRKGSFKITTGLGNYATPFSSTATFSDYHVVASDRSTYKDNSPMGEYGFLQKGTSTTHTANNTTSSFGIIYYQAGLLALYASAGITEVFGAAQYTSGSALAGTNSPWAFSAAPKTAQEVWLSASINDIANAGRHRIQNIEFNNTTKLNSTVYFCRANHNEFNYSSNPSYTSGSQIVVKNVASDNPSTYITSVGLYNSQNEMLAVGKLSEPLVKSPSNELTLRVRLDY